MKRTQRDAELGEALRGLDVPQHEADFFRRLQQDIDHEAKTARPGVGPAGRQRPPALADRRRWLRLAWIPVPVAAVVLALLWGFAGPLGIDTFRTGTASAAEITKKASDALADLHSLRATFVLKAGPGYAGTYVGPVDARTTEQRFTLALTAAGDYRLTGLDERADLDMAYDHDTGVRTLLDRPEPDKPPSGSEATGLAFGPPDPGPSGWNDLAAALRALRESPDAAVKEDTYTGRAVWIVSAPLRPNLISTSGLDRVDVTVLKDSGLPVRAVYSAGGRFGLEWRLEDLEIDPALRSGAFTVDFPSGADVTRTDYGFHSVDLARLAPEVEAVAGYALVLPPTLPEGFSLHGVRVAKTGQPSGKEGMNPAAQGVVSAVYRRGLEQVVVTIRQSGSDPSLWSDPLASGEGLVDHPETVTLSGGVFAGSKAEIVIEALNVPHLWAVNDSLLVTVSGDLTRDELLALAESLAPRP